MSTEQNSTPVEGGDKPVEVTQEEDVGFKVFVGNLSFQTTEDELAQFFAPAGKVLKANIITRGTRSLGYGFVAYETLAEAEKATAELDKKELGGREINVEVAKPKTEGEIVKNRSSTKGEYAPRGKTFRRGRGRGRGGPSSRSRGGWTGPRRFNRRRESDEKGDAQGTTTASGEAGASDEGWTSKSNNEDGWNQQENNNEGEWNSAKPSGADGWNDKNDNKDTKESKEGRDARDARRKPKFPKQRGGGRFRGRGRGGSGTTGGSGAARESGADNGEMVENGEPSKTTVFVANLPFSTDDEGLLALFKEFKVKSAHVVKRRSGRSKGFGFVDLVDEEEQKKVLETMKGVKADDRELIIKVALSEPHSHEKEDSNDLEITAPAPQ